MRVLAAHDSSGADTLQTCALRLAGVYGPGEERHLPRVVVRSTVMLFLSIIYNMVLVLVNPAFC